MVIVRYLILGLSFFLFSEATAQKISGIVRDNEKLSVEYVNIGIVGGNVGTMSNEKGEFKISLADSLNNRVIRFSRLGFKPYEATVKEFKSLFSGFVTLDRDVMKIDDISVQAFRSKRATFKEVMINKRGVRVPGGVIAIQEVPKITVNWVSDPQMGYQSGVVVESEKKYIPQRIEVPILNCGTDSILFRVNIYDIDNLGNIANMLNRDEIFFTARKKNPQKSYTIDLSSQSLSLKGKQYFSIEIVSYSYLLGKDETVVVFPLYSSSSYFRRSSQGAFERVSYNLGLKVWALVER